MSLPFDLLIVDVDGVLTTGSSFYTASGKFMKEFAPHDGDGIKMLRKMSIDVKAVSADWRGEAISVARTNDLGISLHIVPESKRAEWFAENRDARTAFVGDGYYDIPLLRSATVGYVPADAILPVRNCGAVVLDTPGGKGVLLEIALRLRGEW